MSIVVSLAGDRARLLLPETWFPDKGAAVEASLDVLAVSDEDILGFPYGFG